MPITVITAARLVLTAAGPLFVVALQDTDRQSITGELNNAVGASMSAWTQMTMNKLAVRMYSNVNRMPRTANRIHQHERSRGGTAYGRGRGTRYLVPGHAPLSVSRQRRGGAP
jgi:hypothetical protein